MPLKYFKILIYKIINEQIFQQFVYNPDNCAKRLNMRQYKMANNKGTMGILKRSRAQNQYPKLSTAKVREHVKYALQYEPKN